MTLIQYFDLWIYSTSVQKMQYISEITIFGKMISGVNILIKSYSEWENIKYFYDTNTVEMI